MKKIITLILLVAGFVGQAKATMYICGDVTSGGWNPSTAEEMSTEAEGVYYYEYTHTGEKGDVTFCFSEARGSNSSDWGTFNGNSYRPNGKLSESITLGEKYAYGGKGVQYDGQYNHSYKLTAIQGTKYCIRFTTITNNSQVVVMATNTPVYILGNIDQTTGWNINTGTVMDANDFIYTKVINATGNFSDGISYDDYSYFQFSTKTGNGWEEFATYRFGATSDNDFEVTSSYDKGAELTLAYWEGGTKSYKIPVGKYKLTVDFKKNKLKINKVEEVTTNDYGYRTYVNSESLYISSNAYYATDRNNGCAWAVALTGDVASGTPMLIKGTANTSYYFEVSGNVGTSPANNAFKAGPVTELESQTGNNYNYILNGDAFYAANKKNVAANRAYLQLSAPAAARPLIFFDDEDEGTTGINTIMTLEDNADAYYNLNGQRVANPSKGLYIVNGRKMILK